MKKQVKLLTAILLTLSVLTPVTGCKKNEGTEKSSQVACDDESSQDSTLPGDEESSQDLTTPGNSEESTLHTLDTNSYSIPILDWGPFGTIVDSDEPEFPEEFVYWDPTRALKDQYTLEEAVKKYAIVVGHSTLIYTACDELQLDSDFYCTDYGYYYFMNTNWVYFLGSDGKTIDFPDTYVDLKESKYSTLSDFTENLSQIFIDGNFGYYAHDEPENQLISIVEQTDDHIFATVKLKMDYCSEALYYATIIDGKVFYSKYQTHYRNVELTDEERQLFARYSEILFDHLNPDDGTEPYLYDKLVNIPLLGGKHATSFNRIEFSGLKRITVDAKKDSPISSCHIVIDPPDSYLEKGEDDTDWATVNGMQMREDSRLHSQDFVFTIDGTRYLCYWQYRGIEKIDVDSLDGFLKFFEEN